MAGFTIFTENRMRSGKLPDKKLPLPLAITFRNNLDVSWHSFTSELDALLGSTIFIEYRMRFRTSSDKTSGFVSLAAHLSLYL